MCRRGGGQGRCYSRLVSLPHIIRWLLAATILAVTVVGPVYGTSPAPAGRCDPASCHTAARHSSGADVPVPDDPCDAASPCAIHSVPSGHALHGHGVAPAIAGVLPDVSLRLTGELQTTMEGRLAAGDVEHPPRRLAS